MRRRIAGLLLGPAAFVGLLLVVPPTLSQVALAASTTPSTAPYAPVGPVLKTNKALVIIDAADAKGATVTLTATGCKYPEHFIITIHSAVAVIGQADSQPNGDFSVTVTIPSDIPPGNHNIVASGNKGDVVSAAVVIKAAAPAAGGVATTAPSSGFTAGDIAATTVGGAAAICLGGLLVLRNRRRRQRTDATP